MDRTFLKKIEHEFNDKHLSYYSEEDNDEIIYTIPINIENLPGLIFKLYIPKDCMESTCKVSLVTKICSVYDEEKKTELIGLLNKYNNKYSFGTFSISELGNLMVVHNFILNGMNPGVIILKGLVAISSTCEEVAKELLPILWKEREEKIIESDTIIEDLIKSIPEPKSEDEKSLEEENKTETISAADFKQMFLAGNAKREEQKRLIKEKIDKANELAKEKEKKKYSELFSNESDDETDSAEDSDSQAS